MQVTKYPAQEEPERKGLATINEAAHYLAVGRTTLYELLASRSLPSVKIGSCRRIPWEALERFVMKCIEE